MENCLPAIYRTADAIDNLLVKVTINQKSASLLSSSTVTPSGNTSSSSSSSTTVSTNNNNVADLGNVHASNRSDKATLAEPLTVEIAWQQKIFGPRELLLYAAAVEAQRTGGKLPNGVDPTNPLTQEYMQIINKRIDSNENIFDLSSSHPSLTSRLMLYTYTDRDGYIPPDEIQRSYMDSKTTTNTSLRDSLKMTKETLSSLLATVNKNNNNSSSNLPVTSTTTSTTSRSSTPSRNNPSSSALINNVPPSTLTGEVLDPLADPHGVAAHAYKEHPYATMYIMAAVNIDMNAFRNRSLDTSMYEICLGCIRAYPGTSLIEMCPGFGEPVPYDRSSIVALSNTLLGGAGTTSSSSITNVTTIDPLLSAMNTLQVTGLSAVQALIQNDCKLGTGKYGGTLRLRPLVFPSSSSSALSSTTSLTVRDSADLGRTVNPALPPLANANTSNVLAYAIEAHRFSIPDGTVFEYSLVNADEDIYTLLNIKNNNMNDNPALAFTQRGRSRSEAGFSNLEFAKSETDVLAVIAEQEMKAIARAAHRVGSDFHTKVPRSLKPTSYILTYYLEIVTAANFVPSSGNSSIYIAYELVVPKGSGWKLLSSSDVPNSNSSSTKLNYLGNNQQQSYGFGTGSDNDHYLDTDDNDNWDRDPYLEINQENDGIIQESRYMSEGNNNGSNQLRQRRKGKNNPYNYSNAGKTAEINGIDPNKQKQRRWLKTTPVTGITQVAKLRSRPYTFGTPAASVPSGVRSASVTNSLNATSTNEDPFFRVTNATSTTEISNNSTDTNLHHPFGFCTNDSVTNSGIGRIKNQTAAANNIHTMVSTNQTSVKGGAYGEGMGSVSLVSSVHDSMSSTVGSVTTNAPPGGLNEVYEIINVSDDKYVPVATFGYPFEAHILFNTEACTNPFGPSFPTLFFSVYSRDTWDRHYTEGYGYMDLHTQPGCTDTNITCWKPKGNPEQEERDYYLGGATRLEDVTYSRIPSTWPEGSENGVDPEFSAIYGDNDDNEDEEENQGNNETEYNTDNQENINEVEPSSRIASTVWKAKRKAALSKYGFQTITTGTIGIRCNVLKTHHPNYYHYLHQQQFGHHTVQGGDGNGNHYSIVAGTLNTSASNAGSRRQLLDKTSTLNSSALSSSSTRMPLTVEQIIMDAKALRRKDREFREARKGSTGSNNAGGSSSTVTVK